MRWATRSGCHIDRAACAWLIQRFVDAGAPGVDLSHHGGDCSFETMLRHFGLDDPVLWDLARIVHEADLADERFDAPEAAGLDVTCRGLSMVCDDVELLGVTQRLFDGLYEYRRRALLLGREPA